MTDEPRLSDGISLSGRQLVRQLMDEGKSFAEIIEATGFSASTVENYQYAMRRPGETIRPNGRPLALRRAHVKVTMRLRLTPEQSDRLYSTATRYGFLRPALLIEQLVAVIVKDDLFQAVLDPQEEPHGNS